MKRPNDAYVESTIRESMDGKLTTGQAAAKLGIAKQHENRLKKAYAEKGASAFGYGNKGKAKPRRTGAETEGRIAVKPDMESYLFAQAHSSKEIDFYLSI